MKIIASLRRSNFEFLIPILLVFLLAGLAYLPLASQLSYYGDDWHIVWSGYTIGSPMILRMFASDRPFVGWVFAHIYHNLGDAALTWHIWIYLARAAGAVIVFWLARLLWPRQRLAAAMMGILYALYPGFLLMPASFSNQTLVVAVDLGLLSLALTVWAVLSKNWVIKAPAALLSGLLAAGNVFMFEWMIGVEGIRLVLLAYLLMPGQPQSLLRRLKALIAYWLPALAGVAAFLYWRLLIFKDLRVATNLDAVIELYTTQPGSMSLRLVTETIKSYLQTVILAWFVPFYNYMTSTSYVAILIALALALCGAAIFIMVLFRMYREKNAEIEPDVQVGNSRWAGDAILLGALGTLAGLLPAIALNRMVSLGSDTYDRYTLVAILGTIFLVIGAVCAITSSPLRRIVAVSILVLLSISSNYLNANSYRIKTQLARQLWWELTWRAPDLKDGTVVVPLLPRGFRFQDDFDIWPEANLIYRNRETDITIAGQVLNLETARSILAGVREVRNSRNLYFERNYKKTLVLYLGYDSENPSCLHVVNGADVELSQNEDPIIPYVASRSQIDQIDVNGKPHTPPELFFGAEPPHGWCYYYQKASLARQRGDWAEAARLGDEAAKQGFQPQDWVEWLPFLEAYQKMNRPGQVEQILNLYANKPDITRLICQHIPGAPGCG